MPLRIDRLFLSLLPAFLTALLLPAVSDRFDDAKAFCSWRRLKFFSLALTFALIWVPRMQASSSPTFTTLSITPGTSVTQGTALTLQASVDDGEVPVTRGTVTFYDGTKVLAAVQVVGTGSNYLHGTANMKLFLGPGSHPIKAVYSARNGYLSSTSSTETVVVSEASAAATTTIITATGSVGAYTLNGKVTALSSIGPTGNVSFADQTNNNFALGSALLDATTLTGGWQTMTSYAAGAPNYGIVVGDLNGDGAPDIVTSNYGGTTISVFLGYGDGTYHTHVDYSIPIGSFGMALGDLNGDGAPDLVVATHYGSSNISVFLGNGDGTLQTKQDYAAGGASEYVALGDFNKDGKLDVVSLNASGSVNIFLGNGDGTLQSKTAYAADSHPYGLAAGDFNGDGNLDVAVVNDSGNTLSVLLGNGDGTLQTQTTYPTGSSPTALIAVDLNGDGKLDLVACNYISATVSVYLAVGDGTFQAKVDYPAGNSAWGLATADVNADGFADVVVANYGGAVNLLQGNGDGTLKAAVAMTTNASNYQVALADLNGDGVIDLALPNLGLSTVVVSLGSISATATLSGVSISGGGTHKAYASYAGDANSAASTSGTVDLTGTKFSTTATLDVAPASAVPGQLVTLTATVTPSTSSGYTAGGTVTFSDDGSPIGSAVALASGAAALVKSDFAIGSHSITAAYSGDTNFTASTSSASTLVIGKKTQIITFAAMNPVTFGTPPIALLATSDSELVVSFSLISGPATLAGSTLTITGGGSVVVQADQAGDATYQAATPVQRTLTVNKAVSTATVVSSAINANLNASVTFTATAGSAVNKVPTGTFSFMDDTTDLADVALNGQGIATYTTSSLTAGTHSIVAIYNGNANFLTHASTALSQVIVAPDYSITAAPSALTIKRGQAGTSTLTITPVGGYTGQVSFSCSGLPMFASCTFSPATSPMNGDNAVHTVHLTVATVTQAAASTTAPISTPGRMLALALWSPVGLLGLFAAAKRRQQRSKSRWFVLLGIMMLGIAFLGVTGCGSSGPPTSPAGTSNVTVTAAAVGAGVNHSASITITITP